MIDKLPSALLVGGGATAALLAIVLTSLAAGEVVHEATTYFVNGETGSDDNTGTSEVQAWKTLARVNSTVFSPGDRILLRAGTEYAGGMTLHGSGKAGAPIVVDRYGEGAKPRITGTLMLRNVEYWEVGNLEIAEPGRIGVHVRMKDFGVTHHLHFKNLYVHDVKGQSVSDDGGFLCANVGADTYFDDLLIENCRIERADRNGILVTDYPTRSNEHLSLNVVVRGNHLNDIGGDGIFIIGCDGALMERNVVRYAHQRVGRGPGERACAGLWPNSCRNTLVQFNEVSHTAVGGVTVWDSEGFDSDGGCQNTIFQYNYSHDNAGGFLLICGDNTGTIARYNISQNDGIATFSIESSGVRDAFVYNNVIYVGHGNSVNMTRNTAGAPDNIRYYNNIFYADGEMSYNFGSIRDAVFRNNAFYGNHHDPPAGPGAIIDDPLLAAPGAGKNGFDSLAGYMLRAGSPCVGAGLLIPNNGGRDFWGNPVPDDAPPCIGAHERRDSDRRR